MIRFEYKDKEFTIGFSYREKGDISPNNFPDGARGSSIIAGLPVWNGNPRDENDELRDPGLVLTICDVRCGDIGGLDINKGMVGKQGLAFQHPNDQHVKNTARRLALEDAIISCDKGFRTATWDAYFARCGPTFERKSADDVFAQLAHVTQVGNVVGGDLVAGDKIVTTDGV